MATYTDPTTIVSTGKTDPVQPGALVILIGGALSVVVAALFLLQGMATSRAITSTQNDITNKEQQLKGLKTTADQLTLRADQAKDLHTIFDTQKRWEDVLNKLSERLHKSMAVTSIQLTDQGVVNLAGTVPDYTTYAKVFSAFTDVEGQKYFVSAKPTVVSKVADGADSYITFTFTLTLQPLVLNAGSTKEVAAQ